ncbi:MAG: hypothetical protein GOU98_02265, partial [Candidatus Altiarchaeota archaeon]|nr:hypothetical protein [Candidatus Altiarchaeota archaeon]
MIKSQNFDLYMTLNDDFNLHFVENYLTGPFHGTTLKDGSKFDLIDKTKQHDEEETISYLKTVSKLIKEDKLGDLSEEDLEVTNRKNMYRTYATKVINITRKITKGNGPLVVRIIKDASSVIYGHNIDDKKDRYVVLIENMTDD